MSPIFQYQNINYTKNYKAHQEACDSRFCHCRSVLEINIKLNM